MAFDGCYVTLFIDEPEFIQAGETFSMIEQNPYNVYRYRAVVNGDVLLRVGRFGAMLPVAQSTAVAGVLSRVGTHGAIRGQFRRIDIATYRSDRRAALLCEATLIDDGMPEPASPGP
jgi:hypothetical protein